MADWKKIGVGFLIVLIVIVLLLGLAYLFASKGGGSVAQKVKKIVSKEPASTSETPLQPIANPADFASPSEPGFDVSKDSSGNTWYYIGIGACLVVLLFLFWLWRKGKGVDVQGKDIKQLKIIYWTESADLVAGCDAILSADTHVGVNQVHNRALGEIATRGCLPLKVAIEDDEFNRHKYRAFLNAFGISPSAVNHLSSMFDVYRARHGTDVTDFDARINNLLDYTLNHTIDFNNFRKHLKHLQTLTRKFRSQDIKLANELIARSNHMPDLPAIIGRLNNNYQVLINAIVAVRNTAGTSPVDVNQLRNDYETLKTSYADFIDVVKEQYDEVLKDGKFDIDAFESKLGSMLQGYEEGLKLYMRRGDYILEVHNRHIRSIHGYGPPSPPVSQEDWDLLLEAIAYLNAMAVKIQDEFDKATRHPQYSRLPADVKTRVSTLIIKWAGLLKKNQDYRNDFIDRFNKALPPR